MKEEKKPQTEKQPRKAEPVQTGDLGKALKRIRKEYDGDLQAFFRDVKAAIVKRREEEAGTRFL
jgi:hypothetical protein